VVSAVMIKTMNQQNERLVTSVIAAIDEFVSGRLSADEVQAKLQMTMPLLERDGEDHYGLVCIAESNLELIAFTQLRADQRLAAKDVLRDLRAKLVELIR
jgi:hypothetical protein